MKKILCIILVLTGIISTLSGQLQEEPYILHFKYSRVLPSGNEAEWSASLKPSPASMFGGQFFRIIQFFEIPDIQAKERLASAGILLMDYLPSKAYFSSIRSDFNQDIIREMHIRSILEVLPAYKADPAVLEGIVPPHATEENGLAVLTVCYYPNLQADAVIRMLGNAGAVVRGRDDFGKTLVVSVPAHGIGELAALPCVMFVEPVSPEPEPENYTGRTLHHTNVLAADYQAGRQYDGTGVNLMLQDDGIIGPHIDYQGRIGDQFVSSNSGDHGDHCAGIIMAAGNIDPKARGNAFGSTLWVYSVSPSYPGFAAIPTVYHTLGIRVTSASYGDGCNAGYTSLARTLDQQVRMFPSLMHVFSAGNSGNENCNYGAGAGWGNITGGHKQGKNVLAVANLDSEDDLAGSSSRGPAHDGRIKPDIGAKGTSVWSTINPNRYGFKSGTSMACPGVAGSLAQLIQAYRELNNGMDPMAGLLKGIILNTAEDLGNPGPDFRFGWGRINALRAVRVMEEGRYDSGIVVQGATMTHQLVVPAGTAQLRVMVYWTDYEASVNTNWSLVNNLDITLSDPASVVWRPWRLSHFPHPDSLNAPAVRGTDNRNNMEQVTLDNPVPGNYSLTVQGMSVPQGPQTYYLVYEFIPIEAELTYPVGGESLVPGETEMIRWDAYGTGQTFTLEFSSDDGVTWDTIAANISGSARFFNWTVPATVTGLGRLRLSNGNGSGICDAPFAIIGVPCNLAVDWACDDMIHLSWSPVPGATSYEVFRLGEKYMDWVGTTGITSMIVPDTVTVTSSWFSVRATGPDGATGRRAIALERDPVVQNCFPDDLMLASAPTAEWGVFQMCMDLSQVSVPVMIRNFGQNPVVNPQVSYQLDGGTVMVETFNGTVLPDSTITVLFPDMMNLTAPGEHILKAWVTYPPDQNPQNDTLVVPMTVTGGVSLPAGELETFDDWIRCLSVPACELYSCLLDSGWYNLANGVYDEHDWRTFSGPTPTSGTGPDADHTTGTSAGKYLYVEPSHTCFVKKASVTTPCVDLSGLVMPVMRLWYHASGVEIGSFHLDLFDGSTVVEDIVTPVYGNRGNEWKLLEADLTPWSGQVVSFRFRAITGCEDRGDFAVDDFVVEALATGHDERYGSSSGRIRVWPNPFRGDFTLTLTNPIDDIYMLKIHDLSGRLWYENTLYTSHEGLSQKIRPGDLVPGVYILQLYSGRETYRELLIMR